MREIPVTIPKFQHISDWKSEMSNELSIIFSNSTKIYYPGQNLQGEILVNVKDQLKLNEIRIEYAGYAEVHWYETRSTGQGTTVVHFTSHEDYIKSTVPLVTPERGEDTLILKGGQHKYPFTLVLPADIPPSYEGKQGKIEYYIRAILDKSYSFNTKTKAKYTVAVVHDLNKDPKLVQPGQAEATKFICCLCCRSGPLTGKFRVDKLGYVPGEAIPFMAEIINHCSRDVVKAKMSFVQVQKFRGKPEGCECCQEGYKEIDREVKITSLSHGEVLKGDSETWSGEKLLIPPLPVSNLNGCSIMDVVYQLQFHVTPSGPSMKLKVPLDIVIGSIPLQATAKMYGMTKPMTDVGSTVAPPTLVLPENIPHPTYASFTLQEQPEDSKQSTYTSGKPSGNKIGSVDDDDDDDKNWRPQYAYYNWNDYQSAFK